jgi:hypothetical protein
MGLRRTVSSISAMELMLLFVYSALEPENVPLGCGVDAFDAVAGRNHGVFGIQVAIDGGLA